MRGLGACEETLIPLTALKVFQVVNVYVGLNPYWGVWTEAIACNGRPKLYAAVLADKGGGHHVA